MGREIRRVPPDWQHPTFEDAFGRTRAKPLYDHSYQEATTEWLTELKTWLEKHPSGLDDSGGAFWDDYGRTPLEEDCRPHWTPDEATAYQIYETVSEGTPVSPVFATADDLRAWLISMWKLSEQAADYFIQTGWSPSMVGGNFGITKPGADTIEMMARLHRDKDD